MMRRYGIPEFARALQSGGGCRARNSAALAQPARSECASQRVRDAGGFTLAELLLTLALVGLLTMAVATGIGVAVNSYSSIRQASEGQAVLNNAVTAVSDELRFAYDVEALPASGNLGMEDGTAYAFNSSIRGYRLYLGNGADAVTGRPAIMLNAVNLTEAGSYPSGLSTQAALPLVDTATDGGNAFCAQLTQLTWDPGTRMWTFTVQVTDQGATADPLTTTLSVHAVNNW